MTGNAVALSQDMHQAIAEKRLEIRKKYNKKYDMGDIADALIRNGIDRTEEILKLKPSGRKVKDTEHIPIIDMSNIIEKYNIKEGEDK